MIRNPQDLVEQDDLPARFRDLTIKQKSPMIDEGFLTTQEFNNSLIKNEFLLNNLENLGFKRPTAIQATVLSALNSKKITPANLTISAPTGSGKTLSFLLPMLDFIIDPELKRTQCIVLCDGRHLVKQTFDLFEQLVNTLPNRRSYAATELISGNKIGFTLKGHVIVTVPNQIQGRIAEGLLNLSHLKLLVIDEGDTLIQVKDVTEETISNSRDSSAVHQILKELPAACSVWVVTPTPSNAITAVLASRANGHEIIHVSPPLATKYAITTKHEFVPVDSKADRIAKITAATKDAIKDDGKVLIFCDVRRIVNMNHYGVQLSVLNHLEKDEDVYPGRVSGTIDVKDKNVQYFREGVINVLIATDALARGIHIPGTVTVINANVPVVVVMKPKGRKRIPHYKLYVHRCGRARGPGAKAITFYDDEEAALVYNLEGKISVLQFSSAAQFAEPATHPKGFGAPAETELDAMPDKKPDVMDMEV
ncbi:P-loop containing nucleoside triphosphate hydrolase protein [Gaertneriomyces semiglobifer]|nr:P-loop containing nucleoside triphosphate hydrolase protein [Gaertneriomyces semiglobifer]